jgi:hypothetical protein
MKKSLSVEQCKTLLAIVNANGPYKDRALVTSLLLSGSGARTWTWGDAIQDLFMAHAVFQAIREFARDLNKSLYPIHQRNPSFHLINGVNKESAIFTAVDRTTPLTTQDVTRRLKRYAKLAGIKPELMSLRTIVNTHHALISTYGNADAAAEALGIDRTGQRIALAKQSVSGRRPANGSDPRLHGIGRRSPVM